MESHSGHHYLIELERTCIVLDLDWLTPSTTLVELVGLLYATIRELRLLLPSEILFEDNVRRPQRLLLISSLDSVFQQSFDVVGYRHQSGREPDEDDWRDFFVREGIKNIVLGDYFIDLEVADGLTKRQVYRRLAEIFEDQDMRVIRNFMFFFVESLASIPG